MKYCPRCNKQFAEPWLSFCPDDGTGLTDSGFAAGSPFSQPQPRDKPLETPGSEQATMWLPRQPPGAGGWVAPDERPPMTPVWQPPPPPAYVQPPSQGLAIGSMITGIVGLLVGAFCLGPVPGIVALILGLVALSQMKRSPERIGGKPFALVGVITGGLSIVFYGLLIIWFIFASLIFN